MGEVRGRAEGWVFSVKGDFVAFVLPIILALVFGAVYPGDLNRTLFAMICFSLFIDHGHIFATLVPIQKVGCSSVQWSLLPMYLLAVVFCLAALSQSLHAFLLLMAYGSLFHVTRQHYGWLRLSQRRSGSANAGLNGWETLVFWSLILYPILHLHSSSAPWGPNYFESGDLFPIFIPAGLERVFGVLFWLLVASYLLVVGARARTSLRPYAGRIVFMFLTWCYFYVPLFLFKSREIFMIGLLCTHGLSYHYFVYQNFVATKQDSRFKGWRKVLLYLIGICALGLLRKFGFELFPAQQLASETRWIAKIGVAMVGAITIAHYLLDSVIWRRGAAILLYGFRGKTGEASRSSGFQLYAE